MYKVLRRLYKSDNFYVSSGLFTVFSIVAAAISYLIYPVIVRLLPIEVFGDVATSLALSSQFASIFLAFNLVSLYISSNYTDSIERLEVLQGQIVKLFLLISGVALALFPLLKTLLNIQSMTSLVTLLLLVLLSIPAVVWIGFLQSRQELARVGVYTLVTAFAKLIASLIFAFVFRNELVLYGIVIGQLIGTASLALMPGHKLPSLKSLFRRRTTRRNTGHLKFLIVSVVITILMSFSQNADILYGKIFLDSTQAGIFVAISSLSNVAYYGCFILIWITLSNMRRKDGSLNTLLLKKSLALIGAIAVGASVGSKLLEVFILRLLIGNVSSSFHGQFPLDIIYQCLVVIAVLCVFWFTAMKNYLALLMALAYTLPLFILPFILKSATVTPLFLICSLLASALAGVTLILVLLGVRNFLTKGKKFEQ